MKYQMTIAFTFFVSALTIGNACATSATPRPSVTPSVAGGNAGADAQAAANQEELSTQFDLKSGNGEIDKSVMPLKNSNGVFQAPLIQPSAPVSQSNSGSSSLVQRQTSLSKDDPKYIHGIHDKADQIVEDSEELSDPFEYLQ